MIIIIIIDIVIDIVIIIISGGPSGANAVVRWRPRPSLVGLRARASALDPGIR